MAYLFFVVQNSAVWKENFEIILGMEKMNEINRAENDLVKK